MQTSRRQESFEPTRGPSEGRQRRRVSIPPTTRPSAASPRQGSVSGNFSSNADIADTTLMMPSASDGRNQIAPPSPSPRAFHYPLLHQTPGSSSSVSHTKGDGSGSGRAALPTAPPQVKALSSLFLASSPQQQQQQLPRGWASNADAVVTSPSAVVRSGGGSSSGGMMAASIVGTPRGMTTPAAVVVVSKPPSTRPSPRATPTTTPRENGAGYSPSPAAFGSSPFVSGGGGGGTATPMRRERSPSTRPLSQSSNLFTTTNTKVIRTPPLQRLDSPRTSAAAATREVGVAAGNLAIRRGYQPMKQGQDIIEDGNALTSTAASSSSPSSSPKERRLHSSPSSISSPSSAGSEERAAERRQGSVQRRARSPTTRPIVGITAAATATTTANRPPPSPQPSQQRRATNVRTSPTPRPPRSNHFAAGAPDARSILSEDAADALSMSIVTSTTSRVSDTEQNTATRQHTAMTTASSPSRRRPSPVTRPPPLLGVLPTSASSSPRKTTTPTRNAAADHLLTLLVESDDAHLEGRVLQSDVQVITAADEAESITDVEYDDVVLAAITRDGSTRRAGSMDGRQQQEQSLLNKMNNSATTPTTAKDGSVQSKVRVPPFTRAASPSVGSPAQSPKSDGRAATAVTTRGTPSEERGSRVGGSGKFITMVMSPKTRVRMSPSPPLHRRQSGAASTPSSPSWAPQSPVVASGSRSGNAAVVRSPPPTRLAVSSQSPLRSPAAAVVSVTSGTRDARSSSAVRPEALPQNTELTRKKSAPPRLLNLAALPDDGDVSFLKSSESMNRALLDNKVSPPNANANRRVATSPPPARNFRPPPIMKAAATTTITATTAPYSVAVSGTLGSHRKQKEGGGKGKGKGKGASSFSSSVSIDNDDDDGCEQYINVVRNNSSENAAAAVNSSNPASQLISRNGTATAAPSATHSLMSSIVLSSTAFHAVTSEGAGPQQQQNNSSSNNLHPRRYRSPSQLLPPSYSSYQLSQQNGGAAAAYHHYSSQPQQQGRRSSSAEGNNNNGGAMVGFGGGPHHPVSAAAANTADPSLLEKSPNVHPKTAHPSPDGRDVKSLHHHHHHQHHYDNDHSLHRDNASHGIHRRNQRSRSHSNDRANTVKHDAREAEASEKHTAAPKQTAAAAAAATAHHHPRRDFVDRRLLHGSLSSSSSSSSSFSADDLPKSKRTAQKSRRQKEKRRASEEMKKKEEEEGDHKRSRSTHDGKGILGTHLPSEMLMGAARGRAGDGGDYHHLADVSIGLLSDSGLHDAGGDEAVDGSNDPLLEPEGRAGGGEDESGEGGRSVFSNDEQRSGSAADDMRNVSDATPINNSVSSLGVLSSSAATDETKKNKHSSLAAGDQKSGDTQLNTDAGHQKEQKEQKKVVEKEEDVGSGAKRSDSPSASPAAPAATPSAVIGEKGVSQMTDHNNEPLEDFDDILDDDDEEEEKEAERRNDVKVAQWQMAVMDVVSKHKPQPASSSSSSSSASSSTYHHQPPQQRKHTLTSSSLLEEMAAIATAPNNNNNHSHDGERRSLNQKKTRHQSHQQQQPKNVATITGSGSQIYSHDSSAIDSSFFQIINGVNATAAAAAAAAALMYDPTFSQVVSIVNSIQNSDEDDKSEKEGDDEQEQAAAAEGSTQRDRSRGRNNNSSSDTSSFMLSLTAATLRSNGGGGGGVPAGAGAGRSSKNIVDGNDADDHDDDDNDDADANSRIFTVSFEDGGSLRANSTQRQQEQQKNRTKIEGKSSGSAKPHPHHRRDHHHDSIASRAFSLHSASDAHTVTAPTTHSSSREGTGNHQKEGARLKASTATPTSTTTREERMLRLLELQMELLRDRESKNSNSNDKKNANTLKDEEEAISDIEIAEPLESESEVPPIVLANRNASANSASGDIRRRFHEPQEKNTRKSGSVIVSATDVNGTAAVASSLRREPIASFASTTTADNGNGNIHTIIANNNNTANTTINNVSANNDSVTANESPTTTPLLHADPALDVMLGAQARTEAHVMVLSQRVEEMLQRINNNTNTNDVSNNVIHNTTGMSAIPPMSDVAPQSDERGGTEEAAAAHEEGDGIEEISYIYEEVEVDEEEAETEEEKDGAVVAAHNDGTTDASSTAAPQQQPQHPLVLFDGAAPPSVSASASSPSSSTTMTRNARHSSTNGHCVQKNTNRLQELARWCGSGRNGSVIKSPSQQQQPLLHKPLLRPIGHIEIDPLPSSLKKQQGMAFYPSPSSPSTRLRFGSESESNLNDEKRLASDVSHLLPDESSSRPRRKGGLSPIGRGATTALAEATTEHEDDEDESIVFRQSDAVTGDKGAVSHTFLNNSNKNDDHPPHSASRFTPRRSVSASDQSIAFSVAGALSVNQSVISTKQTKEGDAYNHGEDDVVHGKAAHYRAGGGSGTASAVSTSILDDGSAQQQRQQQKAADAAVVTPGFRSPAATSLGVSSTLMSPSRQVDYVYRDVSGARNLTNDNNYSANTFIIGHLGSGETPTIVSPSRSSIVVRRSGGGERQPAQRKEEDSQWNRRKGTRVVGNDEDEKDAEGEPLTSSSSSTSSDSDDDYHASFNAAKSKRSKPSQPRKGHSNNGEDNGDAMETAKEIRKHSLRVFNATAASPSSAPPLTSSSPSLSFREKLREREDKKVMDMLLVLLARQQQSKDEAKDEGKEDQEHNPNVYFAQSNVKANPSCSSASQIKEEEPSLSKDTKEVSKKSRQGEGGEAATLSRVRTANSTSSFNNNNTSVDEDQPAVIVDGGRARTKRSDLRKEGGADSTVTTPPASAAVVAANSSFASSSAPMSLSPEQQHLLTLGASPLRRSQLAGARQKTTRRGGDEPDAETTARIKEEEGSAKNKCAPSLLSFPASAPIETATSLSRHTFTDGGASATTLPPTPVFPNVQGFENATNENAQTSSHDGADDSNPDGDSDSTSSTTSKSAVSEGSAGALEHKDVNNLVETYDYLSGTFTGNGWLAENQKKPMPNSANNRQTTSLVNSFSFPSSAAASPSPQSAVTSTPNDSEKRSRKATKPTATIGSDQPEEQERVVVNEPTTAKAAGVSVSASGDAIQVFSQAVQKSDRGSASSASNEEDEEWREDEEVPPTVDKAKIAQKKQQLEEDAKRAALIKQQQQQRRNLLLLLTLEEEETNARRAIVDAEHDAFHSLQLAHVTHYSAAQLAGAMNRLADSLSPPHNRRGSADEDGDNDRGNGESEKNSNAVLYQKVEEEERRQQQQNTTSLAELAAAQHFQLLRESLCAVEADEREALIERREGMAFADIYFAEASQRKAIKKQLREERERREKAAEDRARRERRKQKDDEEQHRLRLAAEQREREAEKIREEALRQKEAIEAAAATAAALILERQRQQQQRRAQQEEEKEEEEQERRKHHDNEEAQAELQRLFLLQQEQQQRRVEEAARLRREAEAIAQEKQTIEAARRAMAEEMAQKAAALEAERKAHEKDIETFRRFNRIEGESSETADHLREREEEERELFVLRFQKALIIAEEKANKRIMREEHHRRLLQQEEETARQRHIVEEEHEERQSIAQHQRRAEEAAVKRKNAEILESEKAIAAAAAANELQHQDSSSSSSSSLPSPSSLFVLDQTRALLDQQQRVHEKVLAQLIAERHTDQIQRLVSEESNARASTLLREEGLERERLASERALHHRETALAIADRIRRETDAILAAHEQQRAAVASEEANRRKLFIIAAEEDAREEIRHMAETHVFLAEARAERREADLNRVETLRLMAETHVQQRALVAEMQQQQQQQSFAMNLSQHHNSHQQREPRRNDLINTSSGGFGNADSIMVLSPLPHLSAHRYPQQQQAFTSPQQSSRVLPHRQLSTYNNDTERSHLNNSFERNGRHDADDDDDVIVMGFNNKDGLDVSDANYFSDHGDGEEYQPSIVSSTNRRQRHRHDRYQHQNDMSALTNATNTMRSDTTSTVSTLMLRRQQQQAGQHYADHRQHFRPTNPKSANKARQQPRQGAMLLAQSLSEDDADADDDEDCISVADPARPSDSRLGTSGVGGNAKAADTSDVPPSAVDSVREEEHEQQQESEATVARYPVPASSTQSTPPRVTSAEEEANSKGGDNDISSQAPASDRRLLNTVAVITALLTESETAQRQELTETIEPQARELILLTFIAEEKLVFEAIRSRIASQHAAERLLLETEGEAMARRAISAEEASAFASSILSLVEADLLLRAIQKERREASEQFARFETERQQALLEAKAKQEAEEKEAMKRRQHQQQIMMLLSDEEAKRQAIVVAEDEARQLLMMQQRHGQLMLAAKLREEEEANKKTKKKEEEEEAIRKAREASSLLCASESQLLPLLLTITTAVVTEENMDRRAIVDEERADRGELKNEMMQRELINNRSAFDQFVNAADYRGEGTTNNNDNNHSRELSMSPIVRDNISNSRHQQHHRSPFAPSSTRMNLRHPHNTFSSSSPPSAKRGSSSVAGGQPHRHSASRQSRARLMMDEEEEEAITEEDEENEDEDELEAQHQSAARRRRRMMREKTEEAEQQRKKEEEALKQQQSAYEARIALLENEKAQDALRRAEEAQRVEKAREEQEAAEARARQADLVKAQQARLFHLQRQALEADAKRFSNAISSDEIESRGVLQSLFDEGRRAERQRLAQRQREAEVHAVRLAEEEALRRQQQQALEAAFTQEKEALTRQQAALAEALEKERAVQRAQAEKLQAEAERKAVCEAECLHLTTSEAASRAAIQQEAAKARSKLEEHEATHRRRSIESVRERDRVANEAFRQQQRLNEQSKAVLCLEETKIRMQIETEDEAPARRILYEMAQHSHALIESFEVRMKESEKEKEEARLAALNTQQKQREQSAEATVAADDTYREEDDDGDDDDDDEKESLGNHAAVSAVNSSFPQQRSEVTDSYTEADCDDDDEDYDEADGDAYNEEEEDDEQNMAMAKGSLAQVIHASSVEAFNVRRHRMSHYGGGGGGYSNAPFPSPAASPAAVAAGGFHHLSPSSYTNNTSHSHGHLFDNGSAAEEGVRVNNVQPALSFRPSSSSPYRYSPAVALASHFDALSPLHPPPPAHEHQARRRAPLLAPTVALNPSTTDAPNASLAAASKPATPPLPPTTTTTIPTSDSAAPVSGTTVGAEDVVMSPTAATGAANAGDNSTPSAMPLSSAAVLGNEPPSPQTQPSPAPAVAPLPSSSTMAAPSPSPPPSNSRNDYSSSTGSGIEHILVQQLIYESKQKDALLSEEREELRRLKDALLSQQHHHASPSVGAFTPTAEQQLQQQQQQRREPPVSQTPPVATATSAIPAAALVVERAEKATATVTSTAMNTSTLSSSSSAVSITTNTTARREVSQAMGARSGGTAPASIAANNRDSSAMRLQQRLRREMLSNMLDSVMATQRSEFNEAANAVESALFTTDGTVPPSSLRGVASSTLVTSHPPQPSPSAYLSPRSSSMPAVMEGHEWGNQYSFPIEATLNSTFVNGAGEEAASAREEAPTASIATADKPAAAALLGSSVFLPPESIIVADDLEDQHTAKEQPTQQRQDPNATTINTEREAKDNEPSIIHDAHEADISSSSIISASEQHDNDNGGDHASASAKERAEGALLNTSYDPIEDYMAVEGGGEGGDRHMMHARAKNESLRTAAAASPRTIVATQRRLMKNSLPTTADTSYIATTTDGDHDDDSDNDEFEASSASTVSSDSAPLSSRRRSEKDLEEADEDANGGVNIVVMVADRNVKDISSSNDNDTAVSAQPSFVVHECVADVEAIAHCGAVDDEEEAAPHHHHDKDAEAGAAHNSVNYHPVNVDRALLLLGRGGDEKEKDTEKHQQSLRHTGTGTHHEFADNASATDARRYDGVEIERLPSSPPQPAAGSQKKRRFQPVLMDSNKGADVSPFSPTPHASRASSNAAPTMTSSPALEQRVSPPQSTPPPVVTRSRIVAPQPATTAGGGGGGGGFLRSSSSSVAGGAAENKKSSSLPSSSLKGGRRSSSSASAAFTTSSKPVVAASASSVSSATHSASSKSMPLASAAALAAHRAQTNTPSTVPTVIPTFSMYKARLSSMSSKKEESTAVGSTGASSTADLKRKTISVSRRSTSAGSKGPTTMTSGGGSVSSATTTTARPSLNSPRNSFAGASTTDSPASNASFTDKSAPFTSSIVTRRTLGAAAAIPMAMSTSIPNPYAKGLLLPPTDADSTNTRRVDGVAFNHNDAPSAYFPPPSTIGTRDGRTAFEGTASLSEKKETRHQSVVDKAAVGGMVGGDGEDPMMGVGGLWTANTSGVLPTPQLTPIKRVM